MTPLISNSRGRKIFRRYADADDGDVEEEAEDEDGSPEREIKRQAGAGAHTRLKRSSLKPRILFPTEDQLKAKEAAKEAEAAEEALTDIELPINDAEETTSKSKDAPKSVHKVPIPSNTTIGNSIIPIVVEPEPEPAVTASSQAPSSTAHHTPTPAGPNRPKRARGRSPYLAWSHTKPSSGGGAKREGSPLEKSTKRIRSGAGLDALGDPTRPS
jgi:hypothetical protein